MPKAFVESLDATLRLAAAVGQQAESSTKEKIDRMVLALLTSARHVALSSQRMKHLN
jgi:hypothetical protein